MNWFENVCGAVKIGGTLILSPVLRGWYNRWGATPEEVQNTYPGDELVPDSKLGYTRAITIHTAPEKVWAWLVQLGQGRGGMYSYDGLENLAGCDIHTIEKIIPEFQNLQKGDLIRLGKKGYPCFRVDSIDPGHSLVLIGADPKTELAGTPDPQAVKGYSIATWQFILQQVAENQTRLISRQCLDFTKDMAWIWRLTEPIGFIMERKMLLNFRKMAETFR